MSDEFLAKGATLQLKATPPLTVVTVTHSISLSVTGPFATAGGGELLLKSDIEAAFATYVTSYVSPPYTGGTLKFSALKSIDNLSTLTQKKGDAVATKKTTGTITCSVLVPAMDPSPAPDTTSTYDLDFSVADAGQTLAKTD